ncbi:MAG: RES family NAD+ phosphorylase [Nitrococcus sp.]|nr:RES family NAD+ phosphorylase [Nitrococcus sp.]
MRVWRLVSNRRADTAFDGQGAFLAGGRWNPPGIRCVYTSGTSALAVLETLVHMDKRHFKNNFTMLWADIPDGLAVTSFDEGDLPEGWFMTPAPLILQRMGAQWAREIPTAVLQVPSPLAPGEYNFILNPRHRGFSDMLIGPPQPYVFDHRFAG